MNDEQWDAALEDCYGRVLRALAGACGSLERAEDGLQDALVAAWKPGVRERIERPDAWLYRVGLRTARRSRWRQRLEQRLGSQVGHGPAPGVERVAAMELLAKLNARQREYVVARYFLGLSYAEIAQHWGVSVSTATSTVSKAFGRLRSDLEKEDVGWMRKGT
ncbi:MAG: ECF-type sigma factor [Chloroflexota bacterium]|nr:ECF-type sigma factor [Chloroflexota bacterium]